MKIALLANPASGGHTELATLQHLLTGLGAAVEVVSDPRAHNLSGTDRVAVAGGDGSIGPAAAAALGAGLPLAVIPSGTANNFARAMELPQELADACRIAVTGTGTRRVELCRMGGRPFVNCASAGLAVAAARSAKRWKGMLGPLAYALGAARAGMRTPAVTCRVITDDELLFEGSAWQVVIAGTGAFGPSASVGATDQEDGLLDVVVLEAGARLALARRAYGLQTGTIKAQEDVVHRRAARVECAGRVGFNVDGELVPPEDAVSFWVEPRALELVVR